MKIPRRSFIARAIAGFPVAMLMGAGTIAPGAQSWDGESDFNSGDLWEREQQYGDPEMRTEALAYEQDAKTGYFGFSADAVRQGQKRLMPRKEPSKVIERTLEICDSHANLGISRTTAPETVGSFLRLFGLDLRYDNGKGKYVPYCAAGLLHTFCSAYAESAPTAPGVDPRSPERLRRVLSSVNEHYIFPSPAVRDIKRDAIRRGTWVGADAHDVKPGSFVVFSWGANGRANHIGIIRHATRRQMSTIEYNTTTPLGRDQRNGGVVAMRIRPRNETVLGFVTLA